MTTVQPPPPPEPDRDIQIGLTTSNLLIVTVISGSDVLSVRIPLDQAVRLHRNLGAVVNQLVNNSRV